MINVWCVCVGGVIQFYYWGEPITYGKDWSNLNVQGGRVDLASTNIEYIIYLYQSWLFSVEDYLLHNLTFFILITDSFFFSDNVHLQIIENIYPLQ